MEAQRDKSGGVSADRIARGFRNVRRERAATLRLMTVAAVLLCAGLGCSKPVWFVAPDFAERAAKKDNKPILYYFKAWDSTQHRNMLLKVLRDPRVEKELLDSINIELEYGFFDEQSERYKVRRAQVCVFAAPDGSRLTPNYNVNPVPTAEAFLTWLQDAKKKAPKPPTTSGPAAESAKPTEPPAPPRKM